MIRKTVYFRDEEDLAKFNAIKNKAEWLHEHLNQVKPEYVRSIEITKYGVTGTILPKSFRDEPINTPPEETA